MFSIAWLVIAGERASFGLLFPCGQKNEPGPRGLEARCRLSAGLASVLADASPWRAQGDDFGGVACHGGLRLTDRRDHQAREGRRRDPEPRQLSADDRDGAGDCWRADIMERCAKLSAAPAMRMLVSRSAAATSFARAASSLAGSCFPPIQRATIAQIQSTRRRWRKRRAARRAAKAR